jgi:hypothetical protein
MKAGPPVVQWKDTPDLMEKGLDKLPLHVHTQTLSIDPTLLHHALVN